MESSEKEKFIIENVDVKQAQCVIARYEHSKNAFVMDVGNSENAIDILRVLTGKDKPDGPKVKREDGYEFETQNIIIAISHYHVDHYGALGYIIKHAKEWGIKVEGVLLPRDCGYNLEANKLIQKISGLSPTAMLKKMFGESSLDRMRKEYRTYQDDLTKANELKKASYRMDHEKAAKTFVRRIRRNEQKWKEFLIINALGSKDESKEKYEQLYKTAFGVSIENETDEHIKNLKIALKETNEGRKIAEALQKNSEKDVFNLGPSVKARFIDGKDEELWLFKKGETMEKFLGSKVRIGAVDVEDLENKEDVKENNRSIVFEIELVTKNGNNYYLNPGDLEKAGFKCLDEAGFFMRDGILVLQASHHGHFSGLPSEDILKKLNPRVVLISGLESEYDAGVEKTIEACERIGAAVFRTQEQGNMTIEINQEGLYKVLGAKELRIRKIKENEDKDALELLHNICKINKNILDLSIDDLKKNFRKESGYLRNLLNEKYPEDKFTEKFNDIMYYIEDNFTNTLDDSWNFIKENADLYDDKFAIDKTKTKKFDSSIKDLNTLLVEGRDIEEYTEKQIEEITDTCRKILANIDNDTTRVYLSDELKARMDMKEVKTLLKDFVAYSEDKNLVSSDLLTLKDASQKLLSHINEKEGYIEIDKFEGIIKSK